MNQPEPARTRNRGYQELENYLLNVLQRSVLFGTGR